MQNLAQYIHPFMPDAPLWPGCAPRGVFAGDADLPGSRFRMDFTTVREPICLKEPHFHVSTDEYLCFVGADLVHFFDFDAEIVLWLGEDPAHLEQFIIRQPTIVRIPPRLWHGPIWFRRIGKPICFSGALMDGGPGQVVQRDGLLLFLEEEPQPEPVDEAYFAPFLRMAEGARSDRFDRFVFTIPQEHHHWKGYASPRGGFTGYRDMPGSKINFGYSVALTAGPMEVPHIHDTTEEYLFFTGWDMEHFFNFDAEIEVFLGEDPDHMERFVITEPTVIRIPPKLWHCPINFLRVSEPVNFMPMYLDGGWGKITREYRDGSQLPTFLFEGEGLRMCVLEPGKKCTYCGKCFSQMAGKKKQSENEGRTL